MTSRVVNPGARVLVVGGGYSGLRFARAAAGLGAQVWLTHRRDLPEAQGVTEPLTWLRFDADAGAIPDLPEDLTHALITLPPHAAGSDAALMHLLEPLRRQPLRWLGYLSTTGSSFRGSPRSPGCPRGSGGDHRADGGHLLPLALPW